MGENNKPETGVIPHILNKDFVKSMSLIVRFYTGVDVISVATFQIQI